MNRIMMLALLLVVPQSGAVDFGPLEPLVGHCWVGAFPDGKQTDEHCFEWVFDRKFIRDRHVVRGGAPYQGETIYGWDTATKRMSYWYWSSEGFILTGRVDYSAEGIAFPGDGDIKAEWTRPAAAGYRVTQSRRVNGVWKELWTMEMRPK
ncbi:MAG TPA: hypothetical protein VFU23_11820 [Gemmatimonadales bacterium]|nr:hypothetical protein [Gemmatimonadales bacterium]